MPNPSLTPGQQLEAEQFAALLVPLAQREAQRFGELAADKLLEKLSGVRVSESTTQRVTESVGDQIGHVQAEARCSENRPLGLA